MKSWSNLYCHLWVLRLFLQSRLHVNKPWKIFLRGSLEWTDKEWVGGAAHDEGVLIGGGPTNTLAYWQYLTHGQETKAKALCFHWRWMPLLFNASANAHQYDDFSSKWQNMPYTNRDSTMSLEHLVNSFCAWKYIRWISKVLFKAEANMAQVKC